MKILKQLTSQNEWAGINLALNTYFPFYQTIVRREEYVKNTIDVFMNEKFNSKINWSKYQIKLIPMDNTRWSVVQYFEINITRTTTI